MSKIKCITFDKVAQDNLPQDILDKMAADRGEARKEMDSKVLNIPGVSNNEVKYCRWNDIGKDELCKLHDYNCTHCGHFR